MAEGFEVSRDLLLGIRQMLHEQDDGSLILETDDRAANLVMAEEVQAERNNFDRQNAWKGDMVKAASIPLSIWHTLPKDLKNDKKALRKWLDGPGAIWKTRPGKLSK